MPRAVEAAQSTYTERLNASREMLTAVQQMRRDTLQEYRDAAQAQAKREQQALLDRVTEKLEPDLKPFGNSILRRLIGSTEPAMTRISRIRSLSDEDQRRGDDHRTR